jgi:malate dehydrogenase (oxaloacetate-decarboxylating)(NADP+)
MERKGVSAEFARREVRRRASLFGAMMVRMGDADGLICGTFGRHDVHREYVENVIGLAPGVRNLYAMSLLLLPDRTLFLADTYINYDPSAEQLVDMTLLAADEVRRFGVTPRVALLSHSSFGTDEHANCAEDARSASAMLKERAPRLEVEGEMHGDAALDDSHPAAGIPQRRASQGAGQPADHADAGCGQHFLQPAEDCLWRQPDDWTDPARRRPPGEYPDGDGDRSTGSST